MASHRKTDDGDHDRVPAGTEWSRLPDVDVYPAAPAPPTDEQLDALDPREWTRDVDAFYGSLLGITVAAFVAVILYAFLTA